MGSALGRIRYYRRVTASYLGRGASQLSFWWERPQAHAGAPVDELGAYYMTFADKARYAGPFDGDGTPLLHYHGAIGAQYNPIAIAQYGLARYNAFLETGDDADRAAFLRQADWLVRNLRANEHGARVWMHDFDWEYRSGLRAPWYSGLAQGQGLSCLARASRLTGDQRYMDAARDAFDALARDIREGGTCHWDADGNVWIEEYLVDPPSHILNGFMWALWGVHDHALLTGDARARDLFRDGARTIVENLDLFDTGWWSLYDSPEGRLLNPASPFYHSLHVVQLNVMHRLTGHDAFRARASKWDAYQRGSVNRTRALAHKVVFKALKY